MADLHPDLFNGETPIAADPNQPKLYMVKAKIRNTVYVRAFDSEAAMEEAEESVWYEFASDIEAIEATEIGIDQVPAHRRHEIIDAEVEHESA